MNKTNHMDANKHPEIAQFVILDVGLPNLAQMSEAVLNSLSNIICLSQAGHIPAVGLALVNASYQPVTKLSSTHSLLKLHKIIHAIKCVQSTPKCRARITTEEFQDYIHFGIKTVIEDFETLSNQLTEGEVHPQKLQITIFSMRNLSETLDYMHTALPLFKIQYLFKIMVVELVENDMDQNFQKKDKCASAFLEYLQVRGTVEKLTELMKQWLSCGDVQQHVKLIVQDLTIWCDSKDCIIRPSSPPPPPCDTTQRCVEETVEVLEVIHKLPTEGICETQIFGDPVLLIPCQWHNHLKSTEYESLSLNAQYFLDFCNKLGMSDEYLISKYEKIDQPVKFILLIPGAGFLLAKELVSAEMAFPVSNIPKNLGSFITSEIDSSVTRALVKLPSIPSYDPSDFSSGLYCHLMRKIQNSSRKELKKEPPCRDLSHEMIVVEVQRMTKLKRKSSHAKRIRRYNTNELPQLTESDQQTLAQCISKQEKKLKLTLH